VIARTAGGLRLHALEAELRKIQRLDEGVDDSNRVLLPDVLGVLAYSVEQRWREYGVRMALGARADAVVLLIARGAARLLLPGVIIGAVLAIVVGQLLGAMLFAVPPFDPATITFVLAVLVTTAAVAVAGPAFRATRIDPVGALRSE
jgi:putative ABC transport system permease protein